MVEADAIAEIVAAPHHRSRSSNERNSDAAGFAPDYGAWVDFAPRDNQGELIGNARLHPDV
jgi:hypothetical protein